MKVITVLLVALLLIGCISAFRIKSKLDTPDGRLQFFRNNDPYLSKY